MKKIIFGVTCLLFVIIVFIVIMFLLFPKKYEDLITINANEFGLEKSVVASIINIESGYDEKVISSAGAMGLMQMMPNTAEECASKIGIEINSDSLFNPWKILSSSPVLPA